MDEYTSRSWSRVPTCPLLFWTRSEPESSIARFQPRSGYWGATHLSLFTHLCYHSPYFLPFTYYLLPMTNCIFCKIVKGEIPCYKIHESKDFLAFLDISHFTDGHTIVIPKKHERFIWEMKNIDNFMKFAQKISKHFMKNLGYKFVDSASWGRKVPHAHLHLIPHNGEMNDWRKAIRKVGEMQEDAERRLTRSEGREMREMFEVK
jgi:histidine triad (HIT) family protein